MNIAILEFVLILDKAGWHVGQTLKIADNLKLMHLNPCSPEQNLVELLWGVD